MLINWTTPRHRNIGFAQYGNIQVYMGTSPSVTLEELLECCQANYALLVELIRLMKQQGFRKEKISREELFRQGTEILTELRETKRHSRYSGGL